MILKYASILFIVLLFTPDIIFAQKPYTKYWIAFADKLNSPYHIDQPQAFLTAKALERRAKYNIPVNNTDIPVNLTYIEAIKNTGVKVLYTSRWMNGCVIATQDEIALNKINQLPFVIANEGVTMVAPAPKNGKKQETQTITEFDPLRNETYFGGAHWQTQMLNGDYLHAQGYTGKGMTVAVLDAGFNNAQNMEIFEHLYKENRLLGAYDLVDGDNDPYGGSNHGTQVRSIMAGKKPGIFVGACPDANYYLFRTEETSSETRIEEYNWLAAAEIADSLGVDVFNTSLGYTDFDTLTMNYSYNDLDGNTTVIARASDMAASKGILVVNSAGNSGNSDWYYLNSPADADSILTVGAVDSLGVYANFSSHGPTSDGQIKPNVVGQGKRTYLVNPDGSMARSNGTSFSSPLIAALSACLWQANRNLNNMEIIKIIEQSASNYDNPNNDIGYGLPDYFKALQLANNRYKAVASLNQQFPAKVNKAIGVAYPNPTNGSELYLFYQSPRYEVIQLALYDSAGRLISQQEHTVLEGVPSNISILGWDGVTRGQYVIKVQNSLEELNVKTQKL